ncbi:nucleotidyltransferase domain-containing protein [Microcoleus sp. BROC3]|uniref:nucleotidyltransferase domain-containing protein n=1 Tax=Microcoleus sp. BROC3 TaxID=3055323 RepID=UPI002FD01925
MTYERSQILAIAQKHGAYNVRVFGSVARGEATQESDIDLLVDYDARKGIAELGYDKLRVRSPKITLQKTESVCNVLNAIQLTLIKMVIKKVNRIIFVSIVADNL